MAQGSKCRECGCNCLGKVDQTSLHLHVEIENLKQKLLERENHIMTMESNFLIEVDKFPNGEFAALAEELLTWQEKYSRLYESHKRIQKVNQNLEDKLLKIVDKCETEKNALLKDIKSLKQKLVESTCSINWLKEENDRNRNDVNLAIQLLQCKPSNFVSQKFESLPTDLQQKVKVYMSSKRKTSDCGTQPKHEVKTIKVPISTYPPTAMFYSVNKTVQDKDECDASSGKPVDIVSAAIMAKILEEREKEKQRTKHCSTCVCPLQRIDRTTQTDHLNCILPNTFLTNNNIIKIESYQTNSGTPGSAILYERATLPTPTTSSNTSRKSDTTVLHLGRNRYYSSKISKEVGRSLRKEKSGLEAGHEGARITEVTCDSSGKNYQINDCIAIDVDSNDKNLRSGLPSNILLDNATCYPSGVRSFHSQALVHLPQSRSASESASSSEDISFDSRKSFCHTETEI